MKSTASGADDNSPCAEERSNGKLLRSVRRATKHVTVMLERRGKEVMKTPVETGAYPNDPEANSAGEGQGGRTRSEPEGTSGKGQYLIQPRRSPA
jgi:hypothetical protein